MPDATLLLLLDEVRGKTLKLIVGFPTGGGYDIYARAVAKFLRVEKN